MQNLEAVIIRGVGLIGPLGADAATVAAAYAHGAPGFTTRAFAGPNGAETLLPVAGLPAAAEALLRALAVEPALRNLDRAALLAVWAARQARAEAGWDIAPTPNTQYAIPNTYPQTLSPSDLQTLSPSHPPTLKPFHPHTLPPSNPPTLTGIGIGSSRGATGKLEDGLAQFQQTGRVAPSTSPLTTPGNLASAVAHDFLGADGGPVVSHSSTCSSALQALGTGLAWLRAGLADRYLAGGTEAPLTAFTVAQLRAVGIYSDLTANDFPCRPGWAPPDGAPAPNTFVLGEGAAVFALERARPQAGDVLLTAVGFGLERAPSRTGITPTGQHFQQAMHRALTLARLTPTDVDAIVLHAPGTTAGDAAELAAIAAVFGPAQPELLTGKHLTGHTLGASAALSLHYALWLLRAAPEVLPPLPYPNRLDSLSPGGAVRPPRRRVLVNAAGFGGNAACALVELVR